MGSHNVVFPQAESGAREALAAQEVFTVAEGLREEEEARGGAGVVLAQS